MKKLILLIIFVNGMSFTSPKEVKALGDESWSFFCKDTKILYKEGMTFAFLGEVDQAGLNVNELSDYFKLKIKTNFHTLEFTSITDKDFKKDYLDFQVGYFVLILNVAMSIDASMVLYTVRLHHESIGISATIYDGYYRSCSFVSVSTISDNIKISINSVIEAMAIDFYKTRGEL